MTTPVKDSNDFFSYGLTYNGSFISYDLSIDNASHDQPQLMLLGLFVLLSTVCVIAPQFWMALWPFLTSISIPSKLAWLTLGIGLIRSYIGWQPNAISCSLAESLHAIRKACIIAAMSLLGLSNLTILMYCFMAPIHTMWLSEQRGWPWFWITAPLFIPTLWPLLGCVLIAQTVQDWARETIRKQSIGRSISSLTLLRALSAVIVIQYLAGPSLLAPLAPLITNIYGQWLLAASCLVAIRGLLSHSDDFFTQPLAIAVAFCTPKPLAAIATTTYVLVDYFALDLMSDMRYTFGYR